jgi:hypothetical protein
MSSPNRPIRKYPRRRRAEPARLVQGRNPLYQRFRHAPLGAPPPTSTAASNAELRQTTEEVDDMDLVMEGDNLPFVEARILGLTVPSVEAHLPGHTLPLRRWVSLWFDDICEDEQKKMVDRYKKDWNLY